LKTAYPLKLTHGQRLHGEKMAMPSVASSVIDLSLTQTGQVCLMHPRPKMQPVSLFFWEGCSDVMVHEILLFLDDDDYFFQMMKEMSRNQYHHILLAQPRRKRFDTTSRLAGFPQ
jgi:hypothetical protein